MNNATMSHLRSRVKGIEQLRRPRLLAFLVAAGLLFVGFFAFYAASRPVLLVDHKDARWIRLPEPFRLRSREPKPIPVYFHQQFSWKTSPLTAPPPTVHIISYGSVECMVNGKSVPVYIDDRFGDKHHAHIVLPVANLNVKNSIVFRIINANGPPALWTTSRIHELKTGAHWKVRCETGSWGLAVTLDKVLPPAWLRAWTPTLVLIKQYGSFIFILWGVFFASIFGWTIYLRNTVQLQTRTVVAIRILAYFAWLVMGCNNIFKIHFITGMDITDHYDYILYIWSMHHIPPPNAGFEFFQTPLFYLLAARMLDFLLNFVPMDKALFYLKIIPLLCGAFQIELSYRLVKLVYPKRYWLQVVGILWGGFLPMNLFSSQFVGNEPLMGLLGGLCIVVMAERIMKRTRLTHKDAVIIGLILGLAILAKVSAILLFVPILLFINVNGKVNIQTWSILTKQCLMPASIIFVTTSLVGGWYFIYCYMVSGSAIWSNWGDAGYQWWQDAGFRTIAYYTHFGSVFEHPLFASIHSVWDGLYATLFADGQMSGIAVPKAKPPWNYPWMQVTTWVSVLPAILIIAGTVSMFNSSDRSTQRVLQFCAVCLLTFLLAILYLSLIIPSYSSIKSTYALSCVPVMALLMAAGADLLALNSFVRRWIISGIILWSVFSYGAVFVFAA